MSDADKAAVKAAADVARQEARWAATSGAGLDFRQWVGKYGGTGPTANPRKKP